MDVTRPVEELTEAEVRDLYARLNREYQHVDRLYRQLLQQQVKHDREVQEYAMHAARSAVARHASFEVSRLLAHTSPARLVQQVLDLEDHPTVAQVQELRMTAHQVAGGWSPPDCSEVAHKVAVDTALEMRRQDPEAVAGWVERGGSPEQWGDFGTPPAFDAHLEPGDRAAGDLDDVGRHDHVLADVLDHHQRVEGKGCRCGWNELGASWPRHVADVYKQVAALRADTRPELGRAR